MDVKLTLKLDRNVIEKAKLYASERKLSLSYIVESYLQALTSNMTDDEFEISHFVKSISTGKQIPVDLDYKSEYTDYLIQKQK